MSERTCSIEDCGRPVAVLRRASCAAHYRRWQRHGDPRGGRCSGVPRLLWCPVLMKAASCHFDGVQAAPGVDGTADLTQDFRIGPALIVTLSTRTHYMKVWYRRKHIGNWPISTGRPGYDTANGTYLTIEKGNPTRMVGNGYDLLVPSAVRFTCSGNYIHAADWSVAQQGVVNVSHGYVNVSPAHSEIYYTTWPARVIR